MKVFRTAEEVRAAVEEVRGRLGLSPVRLPLRRERFWHPNNKLRQIETQLREAEAALGHPDGLAEALNAFEEVRRLEWELKVLEKMRAARAGGSRGGQAPKLQAAIYQAILDRLRPELTNGQVWELFPVEADMVGDGTYSVYRAGARLYQVDNRQVGAKRWRERSISRATFDRYCTKARGELLSS